MKVKNSQEVEHSFNLLVYKEYIYCYKCEFLTFYKIGDSFILVFIKINLFRKTRNFPKIKSTVLKEKVTKEE